MNLTFKKVKLHNFGSYSDAEINLQDRGFCLVSGSNHFSKDNAASNGSGKSTIFSAICFALTGETLAGVKTNLKNINTDDPECYTTLWFSLDHDSYEITRYHKPKNDLKILKNGVDESGKGITESSQKFSALFPNITKDFIASTILLGQGNVNKFSSFSPSGRKQLLESLTQSDYQIEDIRTRLNRRFEELNSKFSSYNTDVISYRTTITNNTNSINAMQQEVDSAVKPDFGAELATLDCRITELQNVDVQIKTSIENYEMQLEKLNSSLFTLSEDKSNAISKLTESFNNSVLEEQQLVTKLKAEISTLDREIAEINSIKDICPTCGQRIIGIVKQSPETKIAEKAKLHEQLQAALSNIASKQNKKNNYLVQINGSFDADIFAAKDSIKRIKNELSKLKEKHDSTMASISSLNNKRLKLNFDIENWDKRINGLKSKISELQKANSELSRLLKISEIACANTLEHLDVIKKIDTLTKRDLRGYLLEDIIKYIDMRAKDYCGLVFGTTDFDISIDGNNLNISYCNKNFDNLSGGEKQRCDIILQFAIRDLLQQYLNYTSNMIVLDEIFDALDPVATEKILQLINTKLKDIESVFIISHHASELGINHDVEINIIKNELGISEIYEN